MTRLAGFLVDLLILALHASPGGLLVWLVIGLWFGFVTWLQDIAQCARAVVRGFVGRAA